MEKMVFEFDIKNTKNLIEKQWLIEIYKNEKDNIYYLFVNCLTSINVIQHDDNLNLSKTSLNIITTVDPISGELSFKKINSISISENKYLCVSDEVLDSVFKYDLDTYFSNDNILCNVYLMNLKHLHEPYF